MELGKTGAGNKADSQEFHLFPAWVAELGEVGLIVLDFIWHHEIVEQIHEIGDGVSDLDAKLDALMAASPTASKLFQMRKSQEEEPVEWPTPPIQVRSSAIDEENRQDPWLHLIWAVVVGAIKLANWASPLILP